MAAEQEKKIDDELRHVPQQRLARELMRLAAGRNITLRQMAERSGLPYVYILSVLTCISPLTGYTLTALANVLGTTSRRIKMAALGIAGSNSRLL